VSPLPIPGVPPGVLEPGSDFGVVLLASPIEPDVAAGAVAVAAGEAGGGAGLSHALKAKPISRAEQTVEYFMGNPLRKCGFAVLGNSSPIPSGLLNKLREVPASVRALAH